MWRCLNFLHSAHRRKIMIYVDKQKQYYQHSAAYSRYCWTDHIKTADC